MISDVFNNKIGSPYDMVYPRLTRTEEQLILADLFEQLLIFDKITIVTGRLNFPLIFLINHLGINSVERLFRSGYLRMFLWAPMIFHLSGTKKEDGSIDESTIYGRPPIMAGQLSDSDLDPEKNIKQVFRHFPQFDKERIKNFTKIVLSSYEVPKGLPYSSESVKLVIEAYESNTLKELGLPYEKESDQ